MSYPTRELRYYSSIPKILFLLAGCVAFMLIGWFILHGKANGFDIVMSWLDIVFSGLGVIVSLTWFLLAVVIRRPILCINSAGITSAPPLRFWKTRFVPWDDIARISVRVQALSSRNKQYYFLIDTQHPERYTDLNKQSLSARMYPSLAYVAISVMLGWLFFRVSRKRRAQLLERIETTFAPEIIQYNVVIDKVERPL